MASWSQNHQYVEPKESNTFGKTCPATQPAQGSYSVEEEEYICKDVGDNNLSKQQFHSYCVEMLTCNIPGSYVSKHTQKYHVTMNNNIANW